jgi:hypothetical protein
MVLDVLYQCGHELGKMVGMQLPEEEMREILL